MLLDERLVPTESLYYGPRRREISKVDREIEVVQFAMDMALETGDLQECSTQQLKLSALRSERQRLLDCPILDVPGAEQWGLSHD